MDFGPYRILTDEQRRLRFRYADEVLYAIGVYLTSLEPSKNPGVADKATLDRGAEIFRGEGCVNCHVPPDYTSGKLTLAEGYQPPRDHPNRASAKNAGGRRDDFQGASAQKRKTSTPLTVVVNWPTSIGFGDVDEIEDEASGESASGLWPPIVRALCVGRNANSLNSWQDLLKLTPAA